MNCWEHRNNISMKWEKIVCINCPPILVVFHRFNNMIFSYLLCLCVEWYFHSNYIPVVHEFQLQSCQWMPFMSSKHVKPGCFLDQDTHLSVLVGPSTRLECGKSLSIHLKVCPHLPRLHNVLFQMSCKSYSLIFIFPKKKHFF